MEVDLLKKRVTVPYEISKAPEAAQVVFQRAKLIIHNVKLKPILFQFVQDSETTMLIDGTIYLGEQFREISTVRIFPKFFY